MTTDGTWYWGFVAAGDGQGGRAHQRFWNGGAALAGPRPVAHPAADPAGPAGRRARASRWASRWRCAAPTTARPRGARWRESWSPRTAGSWGAPRRAPATTARPAWSSPPRRPAPTRSRPRRRWPARPSERAAAAVAVRASGAEDSDAAPRPELLRQIAEATGGTFSAPAAVRAAASCACGSRRWSRSGASRTSRSGTAGGTWRSWPGALGGEWVLRRRFGHW